MKKIFKEMIPIIAIYPFLTIVGFVSSLVTKGAVKPLFWFNPPSIVYEEMVEQTFPVIADNVALNLIFALFFWGLISSAILYTCKLLNKHVKT